MKIAIATSGRFHVLDLARELHRLGHEVKFYSYVPVARAEKFGLPAACQRCLLRYVLPLAYLSNRGPAFLRRLADLLLIQLLDRVIAWKLEKCDVFIGMSGLCVASARAARSKYGAKIFIERGSTHILRQCVVQEQLQRIGAQTPPIPAREVRRELASYDLADVIVIPSLHVEESFQPYPGPREKLFRNPYGAELAQFLPTATPPSLPRTLLFVGQWSYRKGCDLWERVMRDLPGVRLIHVGGWGDAPRPKTGQFVHHDAVNEWELPKYYAQAHVFVLASREEGLAKVLLQAAACGVPIVCTDQTGGRDLWPMLGDESLVRVVPVDDVAAFIGAVQQALAMAIKQPGPRSLPVEKREQLSWRAYAQRYSARLAQAGPAA